MSRLSNTFEGGADETAVTTGNSGGASGNAFNQIFNSAGNAVVYDDDAGVAFGAMAARCSVAASGSSYVAWTATSWAAKTEQWARFYFATSDATPTGTHTDLCRLYSGASAGANIGLRSTGKLGLRDSGGTLRYTSTLTVVANTIYRVELHVVHSATVGHIEARIFYGANLHDSTPDETMGNLTDNWNLLANGDIVRFGVVSNPGQALDVWLDGLAIDDVGWIGPALVPVSGLIASTLADATVSGTATVSAPTATGTVAAVLADATATGAGTATAPAVTGTVLSALGDVTAAGTGTAAASSVTGAAAISLLDATAAGTGTSTPPTVSGSVAAVLVGVTAAGIGTVTGVAAPTLGSATSTVTSAAARSTVRSAGATSTVEARRVTSSVR